MAEIQRFEPITKRLGDLASFLGIELSADFLGIEITGVTSNSQSIEAGDLFLALPGVKTHGCAFLPSAVERGARAVLTDNAGADLSSDLNPAIPVLVVPNPRSQSGFLSSWFYNSPSNQMYVAGITGTNGKTTTSYLLNQIWDYADISSGLIGTVGIKVADEFFAASHTTPEADAVQRILSVMNERHLRNVVMEVSSHALVQNRVDGIRFSAAGFTNLTQDHLDFHGTMEDYFQAKSRLFDPIMSEHAFINIDNQFGERLVREVAIPTSTISKHDRKATWHFQSIESHSRGYDVAIRGEGGVLIEGSLNLIGEHNLENCILAVAIATHSGVDPLVIGNSLNSLTGAPGRLERIELGQEFVALVDYAHTPDAVAQVLKTVKNVEHRRVIGVLGCGGDRDSSKRPLMGRALYEGCDVAIFTSDNPRSEKPEAILSEMTQGLDLKGNQHVIHDRAQAIEFAVSIAEPGDIVLVMGKGHETGQEMNGVKLPFSDQVELRRAIEARA
jgi:UDP-N-acetylmuramoyl-L-alanyl-D-glutamate--2,6-diaminopimelate ligase